MTIREGTPGDIPEIVNLLRQSLGEDRMPKTEAFWKWKHVQNPFGTSEVLLAWEREQLVGVRAFMKWEWADKSRVYKAVRAVDTATHPDYQGKGIFRTLTLALVERCKTGKVDFIFNTPNHKSRPGYLKMGWRKVGRLPVSVRPVMFPAPTSNNFEEQFQWTDDWVSSFAFAPGDTVTTRPFADYFRWRYGSNPNIQYKLVQGEGYAVVFRLKAHRWGTEFRICAALVTAGFEAEREKGLKEAIRRSGAKVVTWSGALSLSAFRLPVGPVVTWYPLTRESRKLSFDTWSPTLGDLEVF